MSSNTKNLNIAFKCYGASDLMQKIRNIEKATSIMFQAYIQVLIEKQKESKNKE